MVDAILTGRSVGISELREAPARLFEQAGDEALVVLNHNKPAGYIVSNRLMGVILDQLADRSVVQRAVPRLASIERARRINLTEL